jgi:hypothetical protein
MPLTCHRLDRADRRDFTIYSSAWAVGHIYEERREPGGVATMLNG